MDYLESYRMGKCAQVWDDLQTLGETVRREPHYTQAREVAAETMRRVRRNCERLISNLRDLGYVFGTYPDGSRRVPIGAPLTPPSDAMRADCAELEAVSGGDPYGLYLPDPAADFIFLNERRCQRFVSYLRVAILEWGGFPGLAEMKGPFKPLNSLVARLEPF